MGFWEIFDSIASPIIGIGNWISQGIQNKKNVEREDTIIAENREREDNAHQREVADLQAAGLSPLANMTGNGAAAQTATQMEAPQMDPTAMNDAIATLSQREIADKELEQRKTEHQENLTHQEKVLEEQQYQFDRTEWLTKQLKNVDVQVKLGTFNTEQKALIEKANAAHEQETRDRLKSLSDQSQDNYKTFCEIVGTAVKEEVYYKLDDYNIALAVAQERWNLFLKYLATDKKWKKKNIDVNTYEASNAQGGGDIGAKVGPFGINLGGQGGSGKASESRKTFEQNKLIQQAWTDYSKSMGTTGDFKYPVYHYSETKNKELNYDDYKYEIYWGNGPKRK